MDGASFSSRCGSCIPPSGHLDPATLAFWGGLEVQGIFGEGGPVFLPKEGVLKQGDQL